jgi:hypothetical protein
MSTLRLNSPTVSFDGIDLTGFVKDVLDIPLSPWQESMLANLPEATLRFEGFWQPRRMTWTYSWDDLHPETQAYFRRLMAEARARRLSRMRSAYRARRR